MNWEHIDDLINSEALYNFTDRKASIAERYHLVETFSPSNKHDWNELIYNYYIAPNFN